MRFLQKFDSLNETTDTTVHIYFMAHCNVEEMQRNEYGLCYKYFHLTFIHI